MLFWGLLIIGSFFFSSSYASIIETEGRVPLADYLSIHQARQLAVEQARGNAVKGVGALIKHHAIIEEGGLTKETITAYSLVHLSIISRKYRVEEGVDGFPVLVETVRFNLDEALLESHLKALAAASSRELSGLAKETMDLRRKLLEIPMHALDNHDYSSAIRELLTSLDSSASNLGYLADRASLDFHPEGIKVAYEIAKRDIRVNYFDRIMRDIKLDIGKPVLELHSDKTYTMKIPVAWKLDATPYLEILNAHFHIDNDSGWKSHHLDFNGRYFSLSKTFVLRPPGSAPYAPALWDYLTSHSVHLVARFGGRETRYSIDEYTSVGTLSTYRIKLFGGHDGVRHDTYHKVTKERLPLRFEGLREEDVSELSYLDISIEMRKVK